MGWAVLPPDSCFQSAFVISNQHDAERSKALIEPPRGQMMCSVKARAF